MSGIWSLIVRHWKELGITIPSAIAAMGWAYARYRAHRQKRLDTRVFEALGNHVWSRNRPFTGGGETCVRASEIGELFRLPVNNVADSLERLETNDQPDLDETYGQVRIDGVKLEPLMVCVLMAQSALPSLKSRVLSIDCPSCGMGHFSTGESAFTPIPTHKCKQCAHQFRAPGRLRKTIADPLSVVLAGLADKAPRRPQQHELGLLPETL